MSERSPRGGPRPATVQDVARTAGVSTATVSRYLNGSGPVSDRARASIADAVRRLDYVANVSARTLQPGSRSLSWGLLVDDVESGWFGRLVNELDLAAQDAGSTLFVTSTQRQPPREQKLLREMRGRRVDGMLVVPTAGEHMLEAPSATPPVVYIDRIPRGVTGIDVVTVDYYAPTLEALESLWARGHRRFAFVGGNVGADPGSRRFGAFSDFLRDHGVTADPSMVAVGNITSEQAAAAARTILSADEPPTVVVTTNAALVLGVLRVVVELGSDVEIVGSEDFPTAFLTPVPLHLISADVAQLARTAAARLQARIAGDQSIPPETVMLPASTVHYAPPETTRP